MILVALVLLLFIPACIRDQRIEIDPVVVDHCQTPQFKVDYNHDQK